MITWRKNVGNLESHLNWIIMNPKEDSKCEKNNQKTNKHRETTPVFGPHFRLSDAIISKYICFILIILNLYFIETLRELGGVSSIDFWLPGLTGIGEDQAPVRPKMRVVSKGIAT